jgi:hypothetical protein
MKREGDRLEKYAVPIAVIAISALIGLLLPMLSGGSRQPAEPWTPPTQTPLPTATATSTATIIPTNTSVPTHTAAPTSTPAPTATPEATATPSTPPTPKAQAQVTANGLNLRDAPGANSNIVGNARTGDSFSVIGKTTDGNWLQVCCFNEQQVWLSAAYVNLAGSLDGIPAVP